MFEQKKRLKLLHKTTRVVKKSRVMNYKHDNKDISSSGLKEELEGCQVQENNIFIYIILLFKSFPCEEKLL